MNIWDVYQSRIDAKGGTKRNAKLVRESRFLSTKADDNLSRFEVEIDGVVQETFIINTDNLNEKFIYSMPGEDIRNGGLVSWMNNFWLITEKDAATELYTRAKMIQCNYLLRWIGLDRKIHEQWCIVEDGTKYLTGEYEDRDFIVTRGDSRLGLTIARNEETAKFDRERRFLIDDPDSAHMLAYQLTKPFKLGSVFNGDGVFKFVLQEVNTTDEDNQELRIADYYNYFPRDGLTVGPDGEDTKDTNADKRKVWI